MEFNENELNNVVGGANPSASEEMAISNENLFRKQSIEDLKKLRDELNKSEQVLEKGELTEEELDNVKAGHRI